jgi:hypothetical protein
MASDAQITANRANAQLSTGPTSPEGKAKSSLNAVKTGLTGRTVLLPTDDVALYQAHIAKFVERYNPVGDEEKSLVQSIADTEWRLQRIPSLEAGIYALGCLEFAELFPDQEESVRKQLIEAKTFLAYQRQLSNLSVQETRLRRQKEKDLATLKQLQEDRKRDRRNRLYRAGLDYIGYVRKHREDQWEEDHSGFEFSTDEVRAQAAAIRPDLFCDHSNCGCNRAA